MQTRRKLNEVAAAQRGLLTRSDLRSLGMTQARLKGLIRDGTLNRIGKRTFQLGGLGPDPRRPLLAACLDTGGFLSHRSNADLRGLPVGSVPSLPDVLVRRSPGVLKSPLATVHSTTNLPADDVLVVDGIPCVSVARTI